MTGSYPSNNNSLNDSSKGWTEWRKTFLILSLLPILILTLFPYDFFFQETLSQFNYEYLLTRAERASNIPDSIANVLLFIPFGFALTYIIQKIRLKATAVMLVVVATSFALSFTIEFLQLFLPSRNPTYVDLLMNSIGGLIGFLCFKKFAKIAFHFFSRFIQKNKRFLSRKNLIFVLIIYLIIICLLFLKIQDSVAGWSLSNWDSNYPLILGNELTGNRPWRGNISQICIADRAASAAEVDMLMKAEKSCTAIADSLVASYLLTGEGNYRDQMGNLTDLVWQGKSPSQANEMGAILGTGKWLKTKDSAMVIIDKIRNKNQFTLSTTLATADTNQYGPARIISISKDPYHRNLTLGQSDNHLNLRLRTPLTKENAERPEFIVPNFFIDTKLHHLVVTYDSYLLAVYLDNLTQKYTIKLTPETAILWGFAPTHAAKIHINIYITRFYKFLYKIIILLPMVIILYLIKIIGR